ncbi:MAG TPA: bifunctional DNA-formamidopyrimidine glycosylase/DNA-(apurinic or apyrimidinic site) lyase [Chiayiivirga sp.]|nr:bifunctional DNA-formamidopyrimidine glycosylase/DNA-(apurinic or apyrimidinic site) lyase [Chiayiivirga sp.]
MPELPEVETTRAGLAPLLTGRRVIGTVLRRLDLRWPIAEEISRELPGQRISAVRRRAKYVLLDADTGSVVLHLGMSGHLRVVDAQHAAQLHDHLDLCLDDGRALRLTDPRRFGAALWQAHGSLLPLLARLGPEPLSDQFDAGYLHARAHGRSAPVKHFLMDQHIVVGVGNIYAAEALFRAGIHPARAVDRIALARWERLVIAVKSVLDEAITRGGTTLRDFLKPDGLPGYFAQQLDVYGRAGEPCHRCGTMLRAADWGQRATVYCPRCQR